MFGAWFRRKIARPDPFTGNSDAVIVSRRPPPLPTTKPKKRSTLGAMWLRFKIGLAVVFALIAGLYLGKATGTTPRPQVSGIVSPAPDRTPAKREELPKPVHVDAYTKEDGTKVKAHDRAAPGTKKKQ